ncbi:alpha/beta hydrolase [Streptomyces sp. DT171]|uniref:alpha/beta hydrolase n=1 Tax=Streptomyces sp. DT171 TaxID=3416524 RepID=UPI003CE8F8E0
MSTGTGTSPFTWARLEGLRCAELEDAADGWGRASNRAGEARHRIERQLVAGLRETQSGEAADAAVARLKRLVGNFQYIHTECGLVRTTLNSFAYELAGAQRDLRAALEESAALGFTVRPDGSVSYPAAGEQPAGGAPLPGGTVAGNGFPERFGLGEAPAFAAPNPHAAPARDIADRVVRAVRLAVAIDERYTAILRRLRAPEGLAVPDTVWTDAAGDAETVRDAAYGYLERGIPEDGSPAERKAWWEHLTREQREEYLAVYPDRIGNLDGIPALVRDSANRDNLRLLIGELAGRDDETARTRLAGLREIERQLDEGGQPPMYLLGIGNEGNGRAIVSFGDPDTARNVSAYVPGLGTSLDEEFAKSDLKRARDTAKGSMKYEHSSAAIVWLGYDAPQILEDGGVLGSFAVMGEGRAEKGGAAYREFMSGLSVTNENDDPHMTAIGHSYGSRTVGAAARQGGGIPGVDDIVLVGSPGVGVDRAEDLGVGKEHVFVGAAEHDPVTRTPSKRSVAAAAAASFAGPVASYIAGDLADRGDDDLWFGRDPASRAFGARRFHVADGPRLVGADGFSVSAHSQYFDPERDSVSADSIALIAAGRADKVRMEEPR